MTEIRPGTLDDLPAVLKLARAAHDESPTYRGDRWSDEVAATTICNSLADGGLIVATGDHFDDKHTRLVGCILGCLTRSDSGPDVLACESMTYVVPALRHTMLGARLLKAWAGWGVRVGADHLVLQESTGIDPGSSRRLFEGMGLAPSGKSERFSVRTL